MLALSPSPLWTEDAVRKPAAGRLQRVLYAVALDPAQKFGSLEEQMVFVARAFEDEASLFLPLFLCPPTPERSAALSRWPVPAECLDLGRFRWSTLLGLLRLLRDQRVEVIHWNFSAPLVNSYVWWLTVLRPTISHYFTDHNSRTSLTAPTRSRWKSLCKRLLLKRYRKVLCVSRFIEDDLREQGTWSNLECCLYFINTDRFRPDPQTRAEVRTELDVQDRFVLLAVANLIKEKGIDVLLRALAELPADVVLWVAGAGPEAQKLQGLGDSLGLGERVRFLGLQRNVEPYMQAADCFVCPSLWAEAAGLVNLEALAAGLPVVASRIGGIPEYVEDGRTGLLFPAGDHHALAQALRVLHADPEARRRMGRQARAAAVECFSPDRRLSHYLDLYRVS